LAITAAASRNESGPASKSAAIAERLRIIGLLRQRRIEIGQRIDRSTEPLKSDPAVVMRLRIKGPQPQGCVVAGYRFRKKIELLRDIAAIELVLRMRACDRCRGFISGKRGVVSAKFLQNAAAVEKRGRVARLQRENGIEGGQRLLEAPELVQQRATVEQSLATIGFDSERLVVSRERFGYPPEALKKSAAQMKDLMVVGIESQDHLERGERVVRATEFLQSDRKPGACLRKIRPQIQRTLEPCACSLPIAGVQMEQSERLGGGIARSREFPHVLETGASLCRLPGIHARERFSEGHLQQCAGTLRLLGWRVFWLFGRCEAHAAMPTWTPASEGLGCVRSMPVSAPALTSPQSADRGSSGR
jgi:hypothetical protein